MSSHDEWQQERQRVLAIKRRMTYEEESKHTSVVTVIERTLLDHGDRCCCGAKMVERKFMASCLHVAFLPFPLHACGMAWQAEYDCGTVIRFKFQGHPGKPMVVRSRRCIELTKLIADMRSRYYDTSLFLERAKEIYRMSR